MPLRRSARRRLIPPSDNAAVSVSSPVTTQAASSHPALPSSRPMSAETMKIPDPIIEPTTTIVASKRFRTRVNSVSRSVGRGGRRAESLMCG
jgi:hypothetical protein